LPSFTKDISKAILSINPNLVISLFKKKKKRKNPTLSFFAIAMAVNSSASERKVRNHIPNNLAFYVLSKLPLKSLK
jgi:hypothetical protein